MQQFAITCLIIIFIGLTQIVNWVWRELWEHDTLTPLAFLITAIAIGISIPCVYYITLWLYPLIK